MLDLTLFRNRTFTGANLTMLLVALSMFGVFFFVSLFVQGILGYSPVQAGAAFLPMTLCIIFVAPVAGKLSDRLGSRWLMSGGMLLVSVSLLLFSFLDESSTFWDLFPALVVGGVGMALAMTPTTAAAMGSVPVDKAGVGLGRAEHLAPGRRRARHRDHGRDRRLVRQRRPAEPDLSEPVRRRLPGRAARGRRNRVRGVHRRVRRWCRNVAHRPALAAEMG